MLWMTKTGDLKDTENSSFQTTMERYNVVMLNHRQIAEHIRKDLMIEVWLNDVDPKELGITLGDEKKVKEYVR